MVPIQQRMDPILQIERTRTRNSRCRTASLSCRVSLPGMFACGIRPTRSSWPSILASIRSVLDLCRGDRADAVGGAPVGSRRRCPPARASRTSIPSSTLPPSPPGRAPQAIGKTLRSLRTGWLAERPSAALHSHRELRPASTSCGDPVLPTTSSHLLSPPTTISSPSMLKAGPRLHVT